MTENEKLLSLALITLIIAALVIVFIGWFVAALEDEPADQDPPTETVNTETSVEAQAGPVEEAQEVAPAVDETTYEAAWLPDQPYWDTVTGIQDYMAKYWPAGFEPEIEIYLGWKERRPEDYARLISWGRGETPPLQLPPPMEIACLIAAAGQNIDDYLSTRPGSPLQGFGREFARAGYDWGINPYLLVALTGKESTFATNGSLSRTHHNAWGMKGPNKTGLYALNGWMYWEDWPSAIDGSAYFISVYWPGAQTAYNLRGYCAGNPPSWISTVEAVRGQLGGAPW